MSVPVLPVPAAFYLRLAEEPGEDLTTDAGILGRLRSLGVLVPVVVAAEASPAELARSYMIVTEIPGQSLARGGIDDEARRAARAASSPGTPRSLRCPMITGRGSGSRPSCSAFASFRCGSARTELARRRVGSPSSGSQSWPTCSSASQPPSGAFPEPSRLSGSPRLQASNVPLAHASPCRQPRRNRLLVPPR